MARFSRWNDDRLDDLAALSHSSAERITALRETANKHDDALVRLFQGKDRRREHHFQLWLVVVGQLATVLAVIVDILLTKH